MQTSKIEFPFMLMDKKFIPAKLFAPVHITAIINVGRKGKILSVNIVNVAYIKNGEILGANIDTLLEIIAPEIIDKIKTQAIKEIINKATNVKSQ